MNANLHEVLEQHRIPIETAIKGNAPNQSALVARLYKIAHAALTRTNKEEKGIFVNTIAAAGNVTATATDEATGIYVTLSADVDVTKPVAISNGPLLTFGRKFGQEVKPPLLNNTAVKIWT